MIGFGFWAAVVIAEEERAVAVYNPQQRTGVITTSSVTEGRGIVIERTTVPATTKIPQVLSS